MQRGQLDIWKLDISPYDGASLPPPRQPPKYTGPLPSFSATDDDDGKDLTLYTGSCHCGDIQIAAMLKPLDTIPAVECDCSSCNRVNSLPLSLLGPLPTFFIPEMPFPPHTQRISPRLPNRPRTRLD